VRVVLKFRALCFSGGFYQSEHIGTTCTGRRWVYQWARDSVEDGILVSALKPRIRILLTGVQSV